MNPVTSDATNERSAKATSKFLLLLGVSPSTFTSSRFVQFTPNSDAYSRPPVYMVCTEHGIAGLDMLTDHGNHDHG